MWTWALFESQCTGCGICVDLCPHEAIKMPGEEAYPFGVDGACTGCMVCVEECPFDSIVVWFRASEMKTGA